MAKGQDRSANLAARGARMLCSDPDIQGLTPTQLNALHLCKHKMLGAIRHLYGTIEVTKADYLITKYMAFMIEEDHKWDPEETDGKKP